MEGSSNHAEAITTEQLDQFGAQLMERFDGQPQQILLQFPNTHVPLDKHVLINDLPPLPNEHPPTH